MPKVLLRMTAAYDGEVVIPETAVFEVPASDTVRVTLQKEGPTVEQTREVTGDIIAALETGKTDMHEFAPAMQTALLATEADLGRALRTVLSQCKYRLSWTGLSERLYSFAGGSKTEWSLDGEAWRRFPGMISVEISLRGYGPLNAGNASAIQAHISAQRTPFLAYRHLHRALNEDLPRYKWIDATIAAELAIKEFLIRLKPDLKDLILELQAPPLHKLYGPILKSLVGEPSPFVTEIAKGVERRNQLLHRPMEETISPREAEDYAQTVSLAIEHLGKTLATRGA